jgi:NusA-like KH domain protein
MAVINMQTIRYINLLDKASQVRTRKCFIHNNTIFFAVDSRDVSRAIGPGAVNVKRIQEKLGKKVKVIADATGISDVKRFIVDVVAPVKMKDVAVDEKEVVITAGSNQNKASLIGRDKRRFEELRKIVRDFFDRDLRII